MNLGLRMEEMVFNLADSHLFFNDLEECDQVHIDDISSDDNGQDLKYIIFALFSMDFIRIVLVIIILLPMGFIPHRPMEIIRFVVELIGWENWHFDIEELKICTIPIEWMFRVGNYFFDRIDWITRISDLIGQHKYEELLQLRLETENLTSSWLTLALKALNIIKQR